jgi:polyphenol oxidase
MNDSGPEFIRPEWAAPPCVRAVMTARRGGVSTGPYGVPPAGDAGMNVGFGSGDAPESVRENRLRLRRALPGEPRWLKQVHGAVVVDAERVEDPVAADASFTSRPGVVAVVMVADCMPVWLSDRDGRCVGVVHAGWRGLAAGVIQETVRAMRTRLNASSELVACLGPAIGPARFEVGPEVLDAMLARLPDAAEAFVRSGDRFQADLFALGEKALKQAGVNTVHGGGVCTYSDPSRFYSFRRDRITGRHAALVWIQPRGTTSD